MTQKPAFIFVATYDNVDDAKSDSELVAKAYRDHLIGTYDAVVISRDADGKIHMHKTEKPTEHGAEIGFVTGAGLGAAGMLAAHVAGAVIGLFSPTALIAEAAIGTIAGGTIGHLRKGIPDEDQKELGELLGNNPAALVLVAESNLKQALQTVLKRAKTQMEKQATFDLDELKKDLATAS